MNSKSRRGRGAAILAGMALVGGSAAATAGPAQSAPPAGDCVAPFPVSELVDDQPVHGLTVTQGTTPEAFEGEYLGTIDNGIAAGIDMVMVELTDAPPIGSGKIDEVGIWAGMSGSPVYAADGRLIGAVAYGLAAGDSAVAGVTPYENMVEYMASPTTTTRKVAVSARTARRISTDTEATTSEASEGFRRLPMPMAYSGIAAPRLNKVKRKGPDYFDTRVRAGGAASSETAAVPEHLVPGGNLGAAISHGDITLGGVGTVTSVCDGHLIGFGHPMTWGGRTSLGMMPADAVYVQDDLFVSFKVANMGMPAGTITQDRLSGISGTVGEIPDQTDISTAITYGSRSRSLDSHSLVADWNADVTFTQVLSAHDVTVDSIQAGSELASFAISGTDANGVPFDLTHADRYASEWDIAFEGSFDIADTVYVLSQMKGVDVDTVASEADVTDSTASWRIRRVQQRRAGSWVTLNRRNEAVVRPGRTLRLRVQLWDETRTRYTRLALPVPKRAGRVGHLEVHGGMSTRDDALYRAKTPAAVEAALKKMVRNDQIEVTVVYRKKGKDLVRTRVSRAQDHVVRGHRFADVRVWR